MAGACQHCYVLGRNAVFFREVFRYDEIVVGYNSFDSGNNELVSYARFQLFEMSLQIRGGGDEDECVRFLHDVIDV